MMKGAAGILALSLLAVQASAATAPTMIQDRDAAGRNPYQKSSTANCNAKTTCTFAFPKIPANQRLLIEYVARLITDTGFAGVEVKLSAASAPTTFVPFFTQALGDSKTNNAYFPVNAMTRFYVNPGDAPSISVTGTSSLVGVQNCFISGQTISLP